MSGSHPMNLLAGDVGGTKTSLAVYRPEGPTCEPLAARQPLAARTVRSADYADLESAVEAFLRDAGLGVTQAAIGVAGPVVDGVTTATNLPWQVSIVGFRQRLGLDAFRLLNDLEAVAYAIPALAESDLVTLNEGYPEEHGTVAIVAPGTGLGEGYLTWTGNGWKALPSEGGHGDFAPNSALQARLWAYMAARVGHVSWERVCSGLGMANLYAFCRDEQLAPEPDWLRAAIAAAGDPTPVIVTHATDRTAPDPLCRAAMDLFLAILAAEAGNMHMRLLSPGGIYLAGGIPPRIVDELRRPEFLQAFTSKGRLSHVVARAPLRVVMRPDAGLLGAAAYGLSHWEG